MITLPSKNPSQIPYSSPRIISSLIQTVQHVNSCLDIVPALSHPPFILWKGLHQNPFWYTRDYTKKLFHVSRSGPIFFQAAYLPSTKTCLVSFKMCFNHSPRFDLPNLSFGIFSPSNPILSRGPGVGRLQLVHISSQLLFDSIYSHPISNWPWCHPVVKLHPVSLLVE